MKSKIFVTILAICLILVGCSIITYTIVNYHNCLKEKNELLDEFDNIVNESNSKLVSYPIETNEVKNDCITTKVSDETAKETIEVSKVIEDENNIESLNETEIEISESSEEVKEETLVNKYDGYQIICKLEIPSINLCDVVVEGEDISNLKVALGHFSSTPLPGNGANFAVCGHNGSRFGEFFTNLNEVFKGDEIVVTMTDGSIYTYNVYEIYVVEPTDFSILNQFDDGIDRITLMTCTNHGKQRLIVRGQLIK